MKSRRALTRLLLFVCFLAAGGDATVVLDFDAAASVQVNQTGSDTLILRPVVTPKPI